ncbi:hypothetical protein HYV82_01655 [Candidatus Woesearchaeota archaeon]|nr:hypothetical protein [Candidatus Woesearchaeota archaeon]
MSQQADYNLFAHRLRELVGPNGHPIILSRETLENLWAKRANLDDLITLFSYAHEQGCERFFADSVAYFLKKGYTTQDLVRVAELTDHKGEPILDHSNDFRGFVQIKGNVEEAIAVAGVRDCDGVTVFRREKYGGHQGGFEGITDLLKAGGNAQKVQELVDIIGADGISVFRTPRDIIRFIESKGTKTYAQRVVALRANDGEQIFSEFDIGLYKEQGGSIRYAQMLSSLRSTLGQTIFSRGKDIVDFHEGKYGVCAAKKFIGLSDSEGNTVFRDGYDIVSFLRAGGTIDEAKDYIAIADSKGHTYFNGYEIALLRKNQVSALFAASLAAMGLNAETIMYHFKLGLSGNNTTFRNSGKPKALILYPTGNPPDFIGVQAFSDDDTYEFLRKILDAYDVRLRAISTVGEMDRETEQNADAKLLILGGHGARQSLTFGENRPKYGVEIDEEAFKLTVDTKGLEVILDRLPNDAVIFLDSCFNGEGKENEMNMANYVAECAPGRKVISGTGVFNAGKITIKQMFPLDLAIMACYTYQDCTYVARLD